MTELNITQPLSATRSNYQPERAAVRYAANAERIKERYHYEKWLGKRRKDGADKLKELQPLHKHIVSAYISGMKGVEIAEAFNLAAITVYRVLADPLVAPMIEEFDDGFKAEFRALFPLVSNAVREGLESDSTNVKLKAVDRWTRVCRFLDGKDDDDTFSRAEVTASARLRMVSLIKRATESMQQQNGEILEIEATVTESAR